MIITNCPRCGAMNATTTCNECGWSQVTISTVSTRITGEIEIKVSGKALLDDYKRLLFEIRSLTERIAELESAQRWIPVSERLPEDDDEYWVWFDDKFTGIKISGYCDYSKQNGWDNTERVTHWMPLPESPIVYGKEGEE